MRTRLCGDEWQNWANQLLTRHYGPTEYQKIPDADSGDAGLEGFTLTTGHAYQAYGCEEPISVKSRYEKQRTKVTQDINKFINNRKKLAKILGNVKITKWVLFVPLFDSKEIVAHAAEKTKAVQDANLDYADKAFCVVIVDEEQFAAERESLTCVGLQQLECEEGATTKIEIDDWISGNDGLVATLDRKIAMLPTIKTQVHREKFREDLLRHYLDGQITWESLRQYPSIYEKVFHLKRQREKFLETRCRIFSGSNNELMEQALEDFVEIVQKHTNSIASFSIDALAWEAVADWMLRCPMEFNEVLSHV